MATTGSLFSTSDYNEWYVLLYNLQTKWGVTTKTQRTMTAGTLGNASQINTTLQNDLKTFATEAKNKGYSTYPDTSTIATTIAVTVGELYEEGLDINIKELLSKWNDVCLHHSHNSTNPHNSRYSTCSTCQQCCRDNTQYSRYGERSLS